MQAIVQDNFEVSEPFPVSHGVKQGFVMVPTLFSLIFSVMLNDAFCAERVGVDISFRTDGQLFNPRKLKAKTKMKQDRIFDLLFADDFVLNAGSEADLQRSVSNFSVACFNY
jgi:hypothetical protein